MTLSFVLQLSVATANWNGDDRPITQLVAAHLEAWKRADWKTIANHTHDDALKELKERWTLVLKKNEELPTFRRYPPPGKDMSAVLAMPASDFYAVFLTWVEDSRFLMRDVRESKVEVLGVVHEGKGLAHVVVRMTNASAKPTKTSIDVFSLRRSGSDWRFLPPREIHNLVEQLHAAAIEAPRSK